MDPHGGGGGGLTATEPTCTSCHPPLPPDSRFCNKCGVPVALGTRSAEYKQVTVLFADVVHSMDIAKSVEAVASLGDAELVPIKGTDQPVAAQQLVSVSDRDRPAATAESVLVGRDWEIGASRAY